MPLYYTGITDKVQIKEQEAPAKKFKLSRDYSVDMQVKIPAEGYTWFVLQ